MKFLTLVFLIVGALVSQSVAADRYSITKLSDGTARIDHRTGAISYCREQEGSMICSLAAEERQAWISETETLSNRIDRLEKRIKSLEAASNKPTQETIMDAEPELDKAMDFMEKAMRRFSDVFEELKRELNPN